MKKARLADFDAQVAEYHLIFLETLGPSNISHCFSCLNCPSTIAVATRK